MRLQNIFFNADACRKPQIKEEAGMKPLLASGPESLEHRQQ